MTSQLIYVLFIVEIVLILLYIYIPQLVDKIDRKNGTVLLEQGAFLDQSMVIGTSKLLKIPLDRLVNKTEETIYEKNYAFSMWVYLNLKPDTFVAYSKPAPIFDFGNGKLKISYYNNINDDDKKDKYIIQFTDSTKGPSTYELSLPNQKWNNFVFNCEYNKVDLFINGELIRTFNFDKNRPKIKAVDTITVGSENGLAGAICNVRYYSHNLSTTHIVSNYNLLMNKNPPVFIL